jgi:hypothetical protein
MMKLLPCVVLHLVEVVMQLRMQQRLADSTCWVEAFLSFFLPSCSRRVASCLARGVAVQIVAEAVWLAVEVASSSHNCIVALH